MRAQAHAHARARAQAPAHPYAHVHTNAHARASLERARACTSNASARASARARARARAQACARARACEDIMRTGRNQAWRYSLRDKAPPELLTSPLRRLTLPNNMPSESAPFESPLRHPPTRSLQGRHADDPAGLGLHVCEDLLVLHAWREVGVIAWLHHVQPLLESLGRNAAKANMWITLYTDARLRRPRTTWPHKHPEEGAGGGGELTAAERELRNADLRTDAPDV